jgi:hypothetical protein|nr:MAG TPA: hypothetical protein [Caudoviricetes sp.]
MKVIVYCHYIDGKEIKTTDLEEFLAFIKINSGKINESINVSAKIDESRINDFMKLTVKEIYERKMKMKKGK